MTGFTFKERVFNTLEELWCKVSSDTTEEISDGILDAQAILEEEEVVEKAQEVYKSPTWGSFREELEAVIDEGRTSLARMDTADMSFEDAEEYLCNVIDDGVSGACELLSDLRAEKEGRGRGKCYDRRCPHCGAPLWEEDQVEGYDYICYACEENFTGIEAVNLREAS